MDFLISEASFNGENYTPVQWQRKLELNNKSKKDDEPDLTCADGCKLCFRRGSQYTNRFGTPVTIRPHFAHINSDQKLKCLYVHKYRNGGESPEHLEAKHLIAGMDIEFKRVCMEPTCIECMKMKPEPDWTSKTEVRINNRWLADVVYYYPTGDIACVIEIKHSHGVNGEKRKWLMEQPFQYLEVSTDVIYTLYKPTFTIIDAEGDFYCGDNNGPKWCNTLYKRYNGLFIESMLKLDLTRSYNGLFQEWFRIINTLPDRDYQKMNHYGLMSMDDFEDVFNAREVLSKARKDALCPRRDTNRRRKLWKNSQLNRDLLRIYPQDKYPSGKLKGCHILIVAYAYPHSINWVNGYESKTYQWANFRNKYKHITDSCNNLTLGFRFSETSTIIKEYDSSITVEFMKRKIQENLG
ncbi:MAG: hypothetical protein CMC93_00670 [Flavobacteriaceae bacterium]|nr:hypothetical protein [Flavobacteriaceae bacterium]|tara:strand:- start:139 stop:1365 length:1227 start_codon:yes stop_codon:yes gene_type:complete